MNATKEINGLLRGLVGMNEWNQAVAAATRDGRVETDEKMALGSIFVTGPFYVEQDVYEAYNKLKGTWGLPDGSVFTTHKIPLTEERLAEALDWLKGRAAEKGLEVEREDQQLVIFFGGETSSYREAVKLAVEAAGRFAEVPVTYRFRAA